MNYKLPRSVLVIIHTASRDVLLLERALRPGYWQSVTGSVDTMEEPLERAAAREVYEETAIEAGAGRLERWNVVYTFEIYQQWRHRFAPGVLHNVEHVFAFELPARVPVRVARDEHLGHLWLPCREAAAKCFSWSNRDAIVMLGE